MKIAIIQFPGTNCEYETRRAVKKAGMDGVFFRWNEDHSRLKDFDGFIIPGGFSYEDRVRSGIISSLDPIMNVIKKESLKGKPVLGICNGAQILVESGLVPGLEDFKLSAALAVNKRVKDGKVLGTGFYNVWCHIKNDSEAKRTAFTYNMEKDQFFRLPLAHAEGRFVVEKELLDQLIANGQTVFRYCDKNGEIVNEFPTNPNGSEYSLAGVSNIEGNVLALMPHPERTPDGQIIFESMREFIKENEAEILHSINYAPKEAKVGDHNKKSKMEIFVDLIITDNEARTFVNALHSLGFDNLNARRQVHWEIEYENGEDVEELAKEMILSNELLNTSKEKAIVKFDDKIMRFDNPGFSPVSKADVLDNGNSYLIRYREDFVGQKKQDVLRNRLGFNQIQKVKKGLIWQLKGVENRLNEVLDTNILFNPYSQVCEGIVL